MTVQEAINVRKSVRSYTGEPVSEEELKAILMAGQSAPIGMAKYETIHLSVITNKELLAEIDKNAAEFFGNPDLHPLYGAPALIVVSSSQTDNVGSANVAMLVHGMALTAVELGVGHVDIYGATAALAQNAELVAKLNLPEGFKPLGSLAIGKTEEVYVAKDIPADRMATDYIA